MPRPAEVLKEGGHETVELDSLVDERGLVLPYKIGVSLVPHAAVLEHCIDSGPGEHHAYWREAEYRGDTYGALRSMRINRLLVIDRSVHTLTHLVTPEIPRPPRDTVEQLNREGALVGRMNGAVQLVRKYREKLSSYDPASPNPGVVERYEHWLGKIKKTTQNGKYAFREALVGEFGEDSILASPEWRDYAFDASTSSSLSRLTIPD